MTSTLTNPDRFYAARLEAWKRDPVLFVQQHFNITPDPWQSEVLMAAVTNSRIAMKACKGPGKTCVIAWICWWFLLTRHNPKILATSITKDNLAHGLWAEMSKWQQRSPILKSEFNWFSESIKHKEFGSTWFMVMKPWPKSADPEQQANTLAGMHEDNIMFILDEGGGIPTAVLAAAEAALTGGEGTDQKIIMAGNPTHRDSSYSLWHACSVAKHLWWTISITSDPDSPLRTNRVSKRWAQDQIDQHGRHNPWVLVNVFGEFPPTSLNTLLSEDDVDKAMKRKPRKEDYMFMQKRIGVDVARFGDDRTVLCMRQGLKVFQFKEMRNADTIEIANTVYDAKIKWRSEVEYVDGTGGYGAGVVDQLMVKHVYAQEIGFADKAMNSTKFFNKRAEMWWQMAQWVKRGGALPYSAEVQRELCAPFYFYNGNRIQLESKQQIKDRLGFSPDVADALVLTFADRDMESNQIVDDYGITDEKRVRLLLSKHKQTSEMEGDYDHLRN